MTEHFCFSGGNTAAERCECRVDSSNDKVSVDANGPCGAVSKGSLEPSLPASRLV